MTGVALHFADAAAGSLPAICWQTVPSEYATPPRFAQRDRNAKLLAQALLILLRAGLIADGAHLNDKAAAGSGSRRCYRCALGRCRSGDGGWLLRDGAATGAGVGSLPSSTPEAGRWSPRNRYFYRCASAVIALQRVVADRTHFACWLRRLGGDETLPMPPSRFGRSGRA